MEKVKKVIELIKCNITTLVGFEFLFKTFSFLLFSPIFLKSFTFIMKVTGYHYLTIENIASFLLKPITFILILILLLLMMIYTMFDIVTLIVILDYSYQKKKIGIVDAIRVSLKKCKNLFHLKNIPLAFFVLFLIPFLNLGISSSFITTIKIPEFILDFIIKNRFLLSIFILLLIVLIIVLLRWIYSLNYFVLEDVSFKEARKKSRELSEGGHIKDIFTLFFVQLAIFFFYFLYIGVGVLLIVLFHKIFGSFLLLKSIVETIIWIFLVISFIFISLLSTPISYASISVMYYFHKRKKKEEIKSLPIENSKTNKKKSKQLKKVILAFALISLLFGTLFTYGLYKGDYNLNIEHIRTLEITAHRGASVTYPENTMRAFQGAKELGADFIELDVQQTKDRKIIVSHDTNLLRVTGVNKDIIDMNYDEIKNLDAGSFFDKKYKDERIPLFKDVVKWAKENNMKLNVELKPTGKEIEFEKEVIDIIKEYQYEEYCVLTSQVYHVIENAKKYDKNIKTVYVMSLAVGDILLLDKADYFSVEASNVNKAIVKKIHNEGKQLYVWTVNTEENINKMIDYHVDNIITDNITLARETVMKSKTSNLVKEFIKFIDKHL